MIIRFIELTKEKQVWGVEELYGILGIDNVEFDYLINIISDLYTSNDLELFFDIEVTSDEVRIELNEPHQKSSFMQYGILEEFDERLVRMLIPRNELTAAITSILNSFPVKDLEICDPPIEELIGNLFQSGRLPE